MATVEAEGVIIDVSSTRRHHEVNFSMGSISGSTHQVSTAVRIDQSPTWGVMAVKANNTSFTSVGGALSVAREVEEMVRWEARAYATLGQTRVAPYTPEVYGLVRGSMLHKRSRIFGIGLELMEGRRLSTLTGHPIPRRELEELLSRLHTLPVEISRMPNHYLPSPNLLDPTQLNIREAPFSIWFGDCQFYRDPQTNALLSATEGRNVRWWLTEIDRRARTLERYVEPTLKPS